MLALSVEDGSGLEELRTLLAGRTTVLVGESGAGKSTLVNALLASDAVATGATRRDGQGRHTTTWRELLPLPGGGAIVDTPGLRVVHAVAAGDAYDDVAELAARRRFADCRHAGEPGCAIDEALRTGALDPERLAEARRAERHERFEARREDPVARRAEAERWKALAREARTRTRHRPGR